MESGNIEPGYIESMIGREGQANTYLGNGISIPHGMAKDRELIRATGISVVQLPEGVEWGPGKVARLIVGIAAKSDEHLGILAALTDVLDDPTSRIAGKDKGSERHYHRVEPGGCRGGRRTVGGRSRTAARRASCGCQDRWKRRYACAAGNVFVDIASQFESDIRVQCGTKIANGSRWRHS